MRVLRRLRAEFGRLHGCRDGQVMPAFLIGGMTLVMLVVWTLNTGHHVTRKIEVQNAADAATMTQANWTARHMNVMSMNNTAMVQSLAVAVAAEAMTLIAGEVIVTAGINLANSGPTAISSCAACAVPPFVSCILCAQSTASTISAGTALTLAGIAEVNLADITFGLDYHDLAVGFSEMNDHLANTFPEFSYQVNRALAQLNEVDDPLYYPRVNTQTGAASTALPVEVDPLSQSSAEFCGSAYTGTFAPTGMENYEAHGGDYQLGQDGGPYQIIRDSLSDRVVRFGDDLSFILALVTATTAPPYHSNTRYYARFLGGQFDQNADDNAYRQAVEIGWGIYCAGSVAGVLPFTMYRVIDRDLVNNAALPASDQAREALSIVGFARRAGAEAPVVGDRFVRGLEDTYGLAQAEVYNVSQYTSTTFGEQPTSYDLYTQGWRARLVPAGLLSLRRSEIAQAVSDYPKLADLFNQLGNADMGVLNAH